MGEKQDEYEEIDGEYTKEKKLLSELEERFQTLEVRKVLQHDLCKTSTIILQNLTVRITDNC